MLSNMRYEECNLCFLLVFIFVLQYCISLNIEELKPINYEVEILRVPVRKSEEPLLPSMRMMSIYGQEYQCYLPQIEEEEHSDKESSSDKSTDVTELLAPLKTETCLLNGKDWWTYEFCFGQYIKQFHIEDGKILGQVLTLGFYESDYDWNNETEKDRFKNSKQRYHSQYYVNGTKCDLTGQRRSTEVRFYCEEGIGDYIYRVDEPGTCSYVITIHTSRLCSHPLLKPPPSKKAHLIPCHPVVSEQQYARYLEKVAMENVLTESKRNHWLIKQHEKLQMMKNENLLRTEEEATVSEAEGFTRNSEDDGPEIEIDVSGKSEIIKPSSGKPVKANSIDRLDKIVEDAFGKSDVVEDKPLDEAEKTSGKEALGEDGSSEKSKNPPTKEVEEMLAKVEALPEKYSHLQSILRDVVLLTESELQAKLDKGRYDSKTADKPASKPGEDEEEEDEEDDSFITRTLKPIDDETQESLLDDNEVTVRIIRKLDRRKPDDSGQLYEMDVDQKEKLEQAVKEKLEKAGLDTGGRKIEVKIITGYYGNEAVENDVQPLTDEETNQFQNMIMALLLGQKEALYEMNRHKKLEDNYKFLWDENEENEE